MLRNKYRWTGTEGDSSQDDFLINMKIYDIQNLVPTKYVFSFQLNWCSSTPPPLKNDDVVYEKPFTRTHFMPGNIESIFHAKQRADFFFRYILYCILELSPFYLNEKKINYRLKEPFRNQG